MEWQRKIEQAAFRYGGGNYHAPAQLVGDFLADTPSAGARSVQPTYRPGVRWGDLREVLPERITTVLREAIPALGQKLRGFDDPDAVLTEYHLNIGNEFGTVAVHKVGGFHETQFEVEVVGRALRFIFADGTEKLYDYSLEGNRLILTSGDETLVLENLLQEQFASYQKVFDIVVRRAGMGGGPLKLTDAQRQQLTQLVNAGLPEAEDGEYIIYSDECVYDLCGIQVSGAKRIVTLSDRGKVFFDGKAYVLTNADEVLEYIRELYAAAEGYRLMEIKIGRGANDQIQELTMEVGAREGLYVKQVPENPITASPYGWTMSEEGVVEISKLFENGDVLLTALEPGTVTLTVSKGSFSDSVEVHVVEEW
jgi:hypothetical protein